MKILVVYTHPVPDSYNRSVLNSVKAGLEAAGHEYQVADLYQENFQPAMTAEDFNQFDNQPMPDDIVKEQARVEWSDGIVFVFPVWWWSMPGMLKGWIDRVMSYGWAWIDPADPDSGFLKSRKILVLATAGGTEDVFKKRKYDESFYTQLTIGTWDYCGFKEVTTEVLYGIAPGASEKHLQSQIDRAGFLAKTVFGKSES